MSTATWFVMCPAGRAVSLGELIEALKLPRRTTCTLDGDGVRFTTDDPEDGAQVDVTVGLSRAAHVRDEAAQLVASFGAEQPNRDEVARYDARYEILWDAARSAATFHVVTSIAGALQKACGGVIFDSTDGTFV
ncbi:MAG: hypothetical protein AB7K71_17415 [Polyangiaceae bacterium]